MGKIRGRVLKVEATQSSHSSLSSPHAGRDRLQVFSNLQARRALVINFPLIPISGMESGGLQLINPCLLIDVTSSKQQWHRRSPSHNPSLWRPLTASLPRAIKVDLQLRRHMEG